MGIDSGKKINSTQMGAKSVSFNIADNLKKLLALANISEHELSRRTNIKQPIINRLLSGKNTNPKLLTLKPLADYFMLSVSQLIGEDEIGAIWNGFTSKNHKGWSEITILNPDKIQMHAGQTPPKTVTVECSVTTNAFAFYLIDQSMEPILPQKSMIVIEPDLLPADGDYVLLNSDESSFVLRCFLLRSGIMYVNPVNSKFGSITKLSPDEKIIGTVIRSIFNYSFT